ncbi:hypothetical protein Q2K19_10070 [Micromonospora soli]|uniref:hypothetical protein n=1 Tax=Micromonospora sp. NBRC 110009 TaxID=3061627 RepID=UPI002673F4D6|nr:hypothetical protein [Micromonospora sp. NBRC 110009]WKU00787.1 hypothetical protein Q2K19_10070 [Micromonospora sp. NBRC 110009]
MSESAATGQEPDPTSERLSRRAGASAEPDVLLDIPEVTVDQIRLAVDGLDADLSLRARLANLLQLDAGVRVHLEGVELDVTGVSAEALLKVRLEKLVQILDRALTTLDRNPQIIDALARAAATGPEDVNRTGQKLTGEAAPVVNQAGQQIGKVGAVADRTLREGITAATPPTPPTPPPAGRAQPPEPPTGRAGQEQPGGAGVPPSGGGTPGSRRPGGGERPGGGQAGRGGGGEAKTSQGAAGTGGAPPPSGAGPGQGAEAGKPAGAAQLAGQAGETLRQAGRSVWEAIQSGMSQNRPQRPGR